MQFWSILLLPVGMAAATKVPRQAPTVQGSSSLISTNPSAVPLSSIHASAPTQLPTVSDTTYAPGATPPVVGAPPLPTAAVAPNKYPALDKIPPTDSPEVKQWIKEVEKSGVFIPKIPPTKPGGCDDPANSKAAKNSSASGTCWWLCGGCSRETDITTCPDKQTWGVSYDDGPSPYTPNLLRYLNQQQLKSTFFIVGSRAVSRPQILRTEYMDGHQLSVHTWSHPSLTTLTTEQIIAELGWTKKAIKEVTGVTPNTMRPPYGDIDDRVRAISKAMGLTPVIWTSVGEEDFDTGDWRIPGGLSSEAALSSFEKILSKANSLNSGFIVLSHDLYQQTVDLATGYILPDALARGFHLKSIITCLNKPLGDAYVETFGQTTGSGSLVTPKPAATNSTTGPLAAKPINSSQGWACPRFPVFVLAIGLYLFRFL